LTSHFKGRLKKYSVESAHYILTDLKHNVADTEILQTLTTIRDYIRWGASEFNRRKLCFGHGFANAFDEARYLSLHAIALPFDWPEDYFNCVLTPEERQQAFDLLQLRASSHQPAAYITGESWFFGLRFYVDERVLVPRSPIAELIGNYFEPWIDAHRVERILDLCTGSGCIAIACQYAFEDAQICASDISDDALEVAKINRHEHELDDSLTLYQSDLFEDIPAQRFDVIVSNPPYVDARDMANLSEEFTFEPRLGLEAGSNGLDLVDQILLQAVKYLSDHGILVLEVGNSQSAMMQKYQCLPMTWIDFEFGGGGVCCIRYQDLNRHYDQIEHINSKPVD